MTGCNYIPIFRLLSLCIWLISACAHRREQELRKEWREVVQASQKKQSSKQQSTEPSYSQKDSSLPGWAALKNFIHDVDQRFSLGKGVINFPQMAQELCEGSPQSMIQDPHTLFTCTAKLPSILNFELSLELGTMGTVAVVIKALSETTSEKLLMSVLTETNPLCKDQSFFIDRATNAMEFRVCTLPLNSTLAIGRFLGDEDAWYVSVAIISPD